MKYIKLTQDKSVLVDDEDFDYLNQWKWHYHKSRNSGGYAARHTTRSNGKRQRIFMHILINKTPVDLDTDHKNGDTLDNRRSNLRSITHQQNGWNRKSNFNSTSGYKGVSWHKATGKWRVRVCANSEREFTAYFTDKTEAAKAYDAKAAELFGQYARLNFKGVI